MNTHLIPERRTMAGDRYRAMISRAYKKARLFEAASDLLVCAHQARAAERKPPVKTQMSEAA